MSEPVNLEELEAAARALLPAQSFDYIAGGAEDGITLHDNRAAFARLRLRPRYLVDVSEVDLGLELFGDRLALPVLLAPTAFRVLVHAEGELATARAAARAGTVYVASTLSSYALEEIAEAGRGAEPEDGPDAGRWFQLYCARDRGITQALVEAAVASGYRALCLTVDVPVAGNREHDRRNGFHLPPEAVPRNLSRFLDLSGMTDGDAGSALDRLVARLFDPSLTWRDLAWVRELSDLPLLVKGIMTAEDAKLAVEHGVDGIVVSNHGGRQLDGALSTIEVLGEIAEAVDGRCPILLDSGVRRGTDVLKALALGADAVLIGRPYLWGLATGGEDGVRGVLAMLEHELRTAMALTGAASLDALVPTMIERRRPGSR